MRSIKWISEEMAQYQHEMETIFKEEYIRRFKSNEEMAKFMIEQTIGNREFEDEDHVHSIIDRIGFEIGT